MKTTNENMTAEQRKAAKAAGRKLIKAAKLLEEAAELMAEARQDLYAADSPGDHVSTYHGQTVRLARWLRDA